MSSVQDFAGTTNGAEANSATPSAYQPFSRAPRPTQPWGGRGRGSAGRGPVGQSGRGVGGGRHGQGGHGTANQQSQTSDQNPPLSPKLSRAAKRRRAKAAKYAAQQQVSADEKSFLEQEGVPPIASAHNDLVAAMRATPLDKPLDFSQLKSLPADQRIAITFTLAATRVIDRTGQSMLDAHLHWHNRSEIYFHRIANNANFCRTQCARLLQQRPPIFDYMRLSPQKCYLLYDGFQGFQKVLKAESTDREEHFRVIDHFTQRYMSLEWDSFGQALRAIPETDLPLMRLYRLVTVEGAIFM